MKKQRRIAPERLAERARGQWLLEERVAYDERKLGEERRAQQRRAES